MSSVQTTVGKQPGESPKERVDRELRELLEEIRVALPGLELLFGFLLILPFSERFEVITELQRTVYLACFVTTAAATALLIAPTARHRLGFREVDKELLVRDANRQVIAGLALVAVAIALAVYLAVSVMVGGTWAAVLAGSIAGWFGGWWFVFPLVRHRSSEQSAPHAP